jgi:hypothetical protein
MTTHSARWSAQRVAHGDGPGEALRTLTAQPFGTLPLIVVAVGFASFGVCCFYQSRYRKVSLRPASPIPPPSPVCQ